jgi:hypothetical protein
MDLVFRSIHVLLTVLVAVACRQNRTLSPADGMGRPISGSPSNHGPAQNRWWSGFG